MLFQKRVVLTKLDIYVCIMSWLSFAIKSDCVEVEDFPFVSSLGLTFG